MVLHWTQARTCPLSILPHDSISHPILPGLAGQPGGAFATGSYDGIVRVWKACMHPYTYMPVYPMRLPYTHPPMYHAHYSCAQLMLFYID